MITEILIFANIQYEKNNLSVFLIFPKICEKIDKKKNYIPKIYWALDYRLFLRLFFSSHCFFLAQITFFIFIIPYIHFCSYYKLILSFLIFSFLLFSSRNTFYNLQCFIQFHCKLSRAAGNITEMKNTS